MQIFYRYYQIITAQNVCDIQGALACLLWQKHVAGI